MRCCRLVNLSPSKPTGRPLTSLLKADELLKLTEISTEKKKPTTTHTFIACDNHKFNGVGEGSTTRVRTRVDNGRRAGTKYVVVFTNDSVSRFATRKMNDHTHSSSATTTRALVSWPVPKGVSEPVSTTGDALAQMTSSSLRTTEKTWFA